MLNNLPVKSFEFDDMLIEGYSRAAVQTYWRVNQLKMCFDIGAHPWDFMGTPTLFISHTHLDHIAALPAYVARRRMMKMDPPTIYLPEHAVDSVQKMLNSFGRLDRGRLPCNLIGVNPGDEIEHSRELRVTVGKTAHTIPSVCYIVWQLRKKLKPEFANFSGEQIRDIRESGQSVTDEKRIPLLAYMGDTAPKGLDENPDAYRAKVLISELTFVAPDHRRELIHKNGHMHLDDYVKRQEQFENELIVLGHLSTRYGKHQVNKLIDARLPGRLDGRLQIWL